MEFIKEYAKVLQSIAIALNGLQSDKFCFYGCLLTIFLAVEDKLNQLNANQLYHFQALLNAVVEGYDRRFSKFFQLQVNAKPPAVLVAVSNPQFKFKWLTVKRAYNITVIKKMMHEILITALSFESGTIIIEVDSSSDSSSS